MKCCNIKCEKEHSGSFGSGKYCSRQCANSRIISNELILTKKLQCIRCSNPTVVNKRVSKNNAICSGCRELKVCSKCGQHKCLNLRVCKFQGFQSLIKHFGFDKAALGTLKVYEEFNKVIESLTEDYNTKTLSTVDIAKQHGCSDIVILNLLKYLHISRRTLSESIKLSLLKGKGLKPVQNQYKYGWHTTWDNKQVFLRSSYELDYARQLDEQKTLYEVEHLRILYWDSQLLINRVAIPDFYLPQTNTIVEVKSSYTYNEQNMKDKQKTYQANGYKFQLILNKKVVKTSFI